MALFKVRRTVKPGVIPAGLTYGEMAVNIVDKILYVGGTAGDSIEIGNNVNANNTGVTGFNGLIGNVSMTGSGALFGFSNNAIGVRNASASLTGVASFNSANFTISATGHVSIIANGVDGGTFG